MTTPMDGRSTHVRGAGNRSTGGLTTQSASGSGSGLGAGMGSSGSRGGGRSSTGVGSSAGGAPGSGYAGRGRRGAAQGSVGDLAKKLADVEARLSLMEMGARAGQISFTSLMDGDLKAYNLLGELKLSIGKQTDGKFGVRYVNGTAPTTPTRPLVSARQLYIVVGWDGEFIGGQEKPSDFARVDIHLSTTGPDFIPTGATSVGSLYGEGNIAIPADMQDFYIKLVAVTLADIPSAPSAVENVRPLPATAIAAESIAAIHLASEISLSSTFIAGDPDGAHLEMNASGIAMFRADQTPTVMFSTDEGNALITGSIQTALASSGKSRIVFNTFPDLDWNEIRFFAPGDTSWSSLFASRDREGRDGAIALQGFMTEDKPYITATVLGETSILTGIFRKDRALPNGQSPFTDGLLIHNQQTALVGGGGPFIAHNYKRPTPASPAEATLDPFIAWMDSADAALNATSVLEFHEVYAAQAQRRPTIRNLGSFSGMVFGTTYTDQNGQFLNAVGVSFYEYGYEYYIPVLAESFFQMSARESKDEIEELPFNPLDAVRAVSPKRFRYKRETSRDVPTEKWLPDLASPDPEASPAAEVIAARERKTEDGLIPVQLGAPPPSGPSELTYGLLAEDVVEVAPDAVSFGEKGPMLDLGSLIGVLWGAVSELTNKVDALQAQIEGTS